MRTKRGKVIMTRTSAGSVWGKVCMLMLGGLACSGAGALAEVYEIVSNTAVTLRLPAAEATSAVYMRQGQTPWQRLDVAVTDGRMILPLPPATGSQGRTVIVVNPAPGVVIDDDKAPQLRALVVDGAPVAVKETYVHPKDAEAPGEITWEIEDVENDLDRESLLVLLDGARLAGERLRAEWQSPKRLRLTVEPAPVEYGSHTLEVGVNDRAPLRNSARFAAVFEVFDATNVLRGQPGVASVRVDSHYSEYPSVAPLTDGLRTLPGSSAGNDVTWASADDNTAHWIDVTLKAPVEIREVTLYWARPTTASRHLQVQVPDGDDWRVVSASPAAGLESKPGVTLRFEPLVTDRFRVFQPANGGPVSRPGIMWVNEVEAR